MIPLAGYDGKPVRRIPKRASSQYEREDRIIEEAIDEILGHIRWFCFNENDGKNAYGVAWRSRANELYGTGNGGSRRRRLEPFVATQKKIRKQYGKNAKPNTHAMWQ